MKHAGCGVTLGRRGDPTRNGGAVAGARRMDEATRNQASGRERCDAV
jgi:hypothetical protein